jgi:hypothetical protein
MLPFIISSCANINDYCHIDPIEVNLDRPVSGMIYRTGKFYLGSSINSINRDPVFQIENLKYEINEIFTPNKNFIIDKQLDDCDQNSRFVITSTNKSYSEKIGLRSLEKINNLRNAYYACTDTLPEYDIRIESGKFEVGSPFPPTEIRHGKKVWIITEKIFQVSNNKEILIAEYPIIFYEDDYLLSDTTIHYCTNSDKVSFDIIKRILMYKNTQN